MNEFKTITKSEVENGFINSELVEFEDRVMTDENFSKKVEKEAYADLFDILFG